MRIVVDAMGTDDRPAPDVEGGLIAAREFGETIIFVGDEKRIHAEISKHDVTGLNYEVVHTGSGNYTCSYEKAMQDAHAVAEEFGEAVSEQWDGIYVGDQHFAMPLQLDLTNRSGNSIAHLVGQRID